MVPHDSTSYDIMHFIFAHRNKYYIIKLFTSFKNSYLFNSKRLSLIPLVDDNFGSDCTLNT